MTKLQDSLEISAILASFAYYSSTRDITSSLASPRTPLGSLQRFPDPLATGEGTACHPQEPHLRSRPLGPRALAPGPRTFAPHLHGRLTLMTVRMVRNLHYCTTQ